MVGSTSPVDEPTPSQARKGVIAATVGTLLEYFDYYLYGLAAGVVFPTVFFPSGNELTATLGSFATFAVGFLLRPLGGIIFGHIGDRHGRRPALIATIVLMGACTFLIGVIPGYSTIGIWATVALVVLRLGQGLAVGGEMGGAASLAVEYAPRVRRGLFGALLLSGAGVASMLATGSFAAVSSLAHETFVGWAWRIPFLASSLLVVAGLVLRLQVEETPVFRRRSQASATSPRARIPVIETLRRHPRIVALGIAAGLGFSISGYVISVYSPAYLKGINVDPSVAYYGLLVASILKIPLAPLFGILSDKVGRRLFFLVGNLVLLVYAVPAFLLFDTRSALLIGAALAFGEGVAALSLSATYQTVLAESFDTDSRATGIGLGYQCTAALGGGLAPLIATSLVAATGGEFWLVAVYMMVAVAISGVAVLRLPVGSRYELWEDQRSRNPDPLRDPSTDRG